MCLLRRSPASLQNIDVKIEESEKASTHEQSNPGLLACAVSTLPLSYDNWTTTSPHNPLYVQQNIERIHAVWFSQSKCLELLPLVE